MSVLSSAPPAVESEAGPLRLLVIAEPPASVPAITELVRRRCVTMQVADSCATAIEQGLIGTAEAIVVVAPTSIDGQARIEAALSRLAEALASHRLRALFLTDEPLHRRYDRQSPLMTVPRSTATDELWGRLQTIAHYRPVLAEMEHQLENMRRLGKRLNRDFTELDQEMRLASRLQRDFLPRELPQVGPLRFAAIFRPASWVSGDIYDVYRVDETHMAFYVADAVGHGVAAGLLTMFIKQAVQSKRIEDGRYEILSPGVTMARLNDVLADQHLPNSQFVTACYCLVDTRTLEVCFSRGGHPYPLHLTREGFIHELKAEGGLLGLFEHEEFPTATVQLRPGDKMILFSDGLEPSLIPGRDPHTGVPTFGEVLARTTSLSAQATAEEIARSLDNEVGSLNPQDDITLVVLEVTPS